MFLRWQRLSRRGLCPTGCQACVAGKESGLALEPLIRRCGACKNGIKYKYGLHTIHSAHLQSGS